ncbi:MAG: ATP synthase F0 subunit B [Acidobacteriota bacterium]|nr:ATP synthase F0 subunit B [Acidobacteriota bacterium]
MRRLLLILLILIMAPVVLAETDTAAAGTESHGAAAGHGEKVYFGFIPGWVLKTANMLLFFGVLVYFVGGPVKKMFAERTAEIRRANAEAAERREKADRMAGEIQARLAAIEAEVLAIHDRAANEGERQKRELVAAAEAESQKMLANARNEVENRLKHARTELTEFAGQLASERAESILRETITEQDQKNLFQESLREVGRV